MGKVLLFSDIHIAAHKKSVERLNDCLKALEWVFETASKNNIQNIIFAGDLFQDREKIDIQTYHRTFDILVSNKIKLWLLIGNHDMWLHDSWSYHSVKPFSAIENVTVIDDSCTLEIDGNLVDFLPYTHKPLEHLNKLRENLDKRVGRKTLITHLAIDNAQLNTLHNTRSEVAIEHDGDMVKVGPNVFEGWDQVWLGHYHGYQKIKNDLNIDIEYIGSTLQLNFGEAFQHKYVIVYDLETGNKEFIKNEFSPQHFIIPEKDIDKYDIENNFIRIEIEDVGLGSSEIVDIKKNIENLNPRSLKFVAAEKKEHDHLIKDAKAILEDEDKMVENYPEQVDIGELEKDFLVEVGKKIVKEARNINA